MSTFGTILARLDENAKRHDDFFTYACGNDKEIADFLGLPKLKGMDRDERFTRYQYFEALAWEANHEDRPLMVEYWIGKEMKVAHDFANSSLEEIASTCALLEYENGARPEIEFRPEK